MAGPARKKRKLSSKPKGQGVSTTSKGKSSYEPKHTLYVNNLSDHIGVNRLRANLYLLFSIYGEVIRITVNPKKQRGQAFVTMRSIDESNLAIISLNNEPFFGKPLHVSFSNKETTKL